MYGRAQTCDLVEKFKLYHGSVKSFSAIFTSDWDRPRPADLHAAFHYKSTRGGVSEQLLREYTG